MLPRLFLDREPPDLCVISPSDQKMEQERWSDICSQFGFFDFSLEPKGTEVHGARDHFQECVQHSEPLAASRCSVHLACNTDHVPLPAARCPPRPATSTPTGHSRRGSRSPQAFLCTKPEEPPNGNVSWAQNRAGGGGPMRLVSPGVCEHQGSLHLSHPGCRAEPRKLRPSRTHTEVRAHTPTLTHAHPPTWPLPPTLPTPAKL